MRLPHEEHRSHSVRFDLCGIHRGDTSRSIPPSITTPDTVQTRIGTLKFFDGLPDAETVRKAYDQVDFGRGAEAFLSGVPAASVHAMCNGSVQRPIRRSASPKT